MQKVQHSISVEDSDLDETVVGWNNDRPVRCVHNVQYHSLLCNYNVRATGTRFG